MNLRFVFKSTGLAILLGLESVSTPAQILMSGGNYTQDFDSLATGGTSNPWENNATLPGWYASKSAGDPTITTYRAESGTSNAGALYSFGAAGVSNLTERALGSISSATPGTIAFGIRFLNDTGTTLTNLTIGFTGEQWRNGGNTSAHVLAFSFRVSAVPITDSDAGNSEVWNNYSSLDFVTPTVGSSASALDGNATSNRIVIPATLLAGVTVAPGHEIFLRWMDVNDAGNDHGFGVDDLMVSFDTGNAMPAAPEISTQPADQNTFAGDNVLFTAAASGHPLPTYQWQFQTTNIPGATSATLLLINVPLSAAGGYRVIAANSEGSATSAVATLTVTPPPANFSLLTYNVRGNGVTNWTTNSLQIQAIARQLQYLQPDIIAFNEIPWDYRFEMNNFVAAFLPSHQIVISSGTDGSLCSAIASRYPITRASKWLDGVDLRSFGYSNANNALDNFTRDLYEAQISVPGFARPVHVFTTHLKATASGEYEENAAKRAAEAAAITNFFATTLFALYPYDLYLLAGDLNASDTNELCIQKLLSPVTGLQMTLPRNPVTGSINTYSTTFANPSSRLDYIFPNTLLYSNIKTSLVFRSSLVSPLPPELNSNDSQVASDHYPVLMVFNDPYSRTFKLSVVQSNLTATLHWESVFGLAYRVESSTNLTTWITEANNLVATGTNTSFNANLNGAGRYFRVRKLP